MQTSCNFHHWNLLRFSSNFHHPGPPSSLPSTPAVLLTVATTVETSCTWALWVRALWSSMIPWHPHKGNSWNRNPTNLMEFGSVMFLWFSGKVGSRDIYQHIPFTTFVWGYTMTVLGQYGNILKVHFPPPAPRASDPTSGNSVTVGTSTLPCTGPACSRARFGPWGTSKTDSTPRAKAKVKRMQRRHITSRHAPKKVTRKPSKGQLFAGKKRKGCIGCGVHPPERNQMGMHNTHVFNARWKLLNESAEGSTTPWNWTGNLKKKRLSGRSCPFPNHLFLVLMLEFPGCTIMVPVLSGQLEFLLSSYQAFQIFRKDQALSHQEF